MMIQSNLPNFEIPTGLMATGLQGLRGFGRGLAGAIDVSALAQAQFRGQITPSWAPAPMVLSGPDPDPQPLPAWLYATQQFAQQLASLLGGTAVQAPPNYFFGTIVYNGQVTTTLPPAWQVSIGGQLVLPGALFQPGVILSFPDECTAENYFAESIPGATVSATCAAGGTGLTPTQLAIDNGATPPVTPGGQSTIVGYTPPTSIPAQPPITTITNPVTVANPTGQPVTVAPAVQPTCSSVQQNIAQWQAAGLSNATIWATIQQQAPQLLSCPSVMALNPGAYTAPQNAEQPGQVQYPKGTGTQQTQQDNSQSSSGSSNTALYIGLAIAAALLLGGRKL